MLQIKVFPLASLDEQAVNEFIAAHKVTKDFTVSEGKMILFYNDDKPIGLIEDGILNYLSEELGKVQMNYLEADAAMRFWDDKFKSPRKHGEESQTEALQNYQVNVRSVRAAGRQIRILQGLIADVKAQKFQFTDQVDVPATMQAEAPAKPAEAAPTPAPEPTPVHRGKRGK